MHPHIFPMTQVGGELGKVKGLVARAEVSLHELSSSTDSEKAWSYAARLEDVGKPWENHSAMAVSWGLMVVWWWFDGGLMVVWQWYGLIMLFI